MYASIGAMFMWRLIKMLFKTVSAPELAFEKFASKDVAAKVNLTTGKRLMLYHFPVEKWELFERTDADDRL